MEIIKEVIMNAIKRVKNNSLYKEYNALGSLTREKIIDDLQIMNLHRIVIFSVGIILFLFCDMFYRIMNNKVVEQDVIVYIVFIAILVSYLFVMNYILKDKINKLYKVIYLSYWILLLFVFLITIYDSLAKNNQFICSLFLFVAICNIPILSGKDYLYLLAVQLFYVLLVIINQRHDDVLIYNMLIISIATYGFSRINYSTYLSLLVKEKKLLESNSSLQDLALKDSLTGILNRRGLDDKLDLLWPLCIRDSLSVTIIMIDIDYFKKYNDRFGHSEGDRCLKEVANAIRQGAKRKTDVISRIGGEEFLVFAHNMDAKNALILAREIKENIEKIRLYTDNDEIVNQVTASIGVAEMIPNRENMILDLYNKADKALYQAKEVGRNCIIMDNEIIE